MNNIDCIISNKNITANAKILFNDIINLSRKKGYCFANNNFFAKKYNVTKRAVQKWIEQLKKEGLVKINITFKENMKWVDERQISLTEKTKNLLNFKDKRSDKKSNSTNEKSNDKIQIEEPLKQEFIEMLNKHFENKLNEKEVFDILKALSFKKIDNAEYLKEKLEVLENAKNINSPIGFLIKAIMENMQPSKIKPKKENGLNVHTRHHEIEQGYRKYTEEELENMLRTNKKHRTQEDIERIQKIAEEHEKRRKIHLETLRFDLPEQIYEKLKKGVEYFNSLHESEKYEIEYELSKINIKIEKILGFDKLAT